MNLPKFSVRRPVFMTMVTMIVIILGLVSFNKLKIDLLPNIELPTLTIGTRYDGASPEVMEQMVTQIIEEIVGTVPGIEEMTSESSEGDSDVRLRFVWGTNIDAAAIDVMGVVEDEINELPEDVDRPRLGKYDPNSFPVVVLGISSNLDPIELTELVENQIRYRFARIPGVSQVDVWGGFRREIRIELDADRINALGLPLDRILQAIRDSNLDLPAGRIEEGTYEISLRAPAQFTNVDQIRQTILETREGAVVKLGEISTVKDTYEKLTRVVRVNNERGVRAALRKQADANTVEVSKAVLEEIDKANRDFPQLHIVPVINQGNFIERSIDNVFRSVLYGGGLAILTLLFFLRNIRSTLVISLSIPISIIATFALIYFCGFTLNLMTLGGLALGVGMMVDSSIVVLENIFRRHDEDKEAPDIAAADGAREVGPAIIASTITTLVIFLPIVFVRGVSGILFRELAYVIVFSLVCSLLVSLSVVPMLAAKLLGTSNKKKGHRSAWIERIAAKADASFNSLDTAYRNTLKWVLKHRWQTVSGTAGLLILSLALVPFIGAEFLPPSDEGEVSVEGEMEMGTRIDLLDQQTRLMESIVYPAVPEKVSTVASVRGQEGEIDISLKPRKERTRSSAEIADDLRVRLEGQVPGMDIRVRARQGQFFLNRLFGSEEGLTVEVRGHELDILNALAEKAAEVIADVPGISDVDSGVDPGLPQHEIRLDRDKVGDLGLSVRDVTEVLQTAIAGSTAGSFRAEGNAYRILVQLKDAEKLSLDQVLNITLTTPSGELVALRNLVTTVESRAPTEIYRKDKQRQVTVEANVAGKDQGSVAAEVQARLDQIPRPEGYDLMVSGSFAEQQEAFRDLMISLLLALLLVYMVLACQYESFRNPLIVMFSAPMAAIGVLLMLFLTHTTWNLQSVIGCIMLGGIVVNNAILLVDQASQLCSKGMRVREAVAEAGRRRFRPILMTTLTTIFGLLPLALGIGEGADAQAPLARAVIGGLTASTVITLALIPAVYSLFHSDPENSTH